MHKDDSFVQLLMEKNWKYLSTEKMFVQILIELN